ncbi:MAG TPA: adenylate/guanylate cyclase domain-containing protein [Xanthobacteraceae bacterium]|jgi:class 3 adenylate cyclase|nr:adenylate/guanylate cyclase domain-containing protein [Stellaceae bacterium]
MSVPEATAAAQPRRPLFQKYFAALFVAVVVPLLANGASEAWFGYRDQRVTLSQRLHAEAGTSAGKIQAFLDDITDQLQWTVQLPWREGIDERRRFDVLRLMRQVPAVVEITLVDGKSVERLHVSRVDPDIVDSGIDRTNDPAVIGARSGQIWYGPVTLHEGSEPHMTVAVAGAREINGITVAVINLKLIWDVVSAIHVGQSGDAFVLDRSGRLVAHPDISLVLRGDDDPAAARLKDLQKATIDGGETADGINAEGRSVIAAMAPIPGPDWMAFVEQPAAEAFTPIRAALWRTGFLLLVGAVFAALLAYLLARRMAGPIRLLEQGAERIGAGQFDHKIEISTGDELEGLAQRFNDMAVELAVSQERSERIARLKRFLAPQVAELVEGSEQEALLDSHRAEVVVIFCDLRGFTGFSAAAGPEEVMGLVQEYYEALGAIIGRYEATLTCFMGDGLMLLLNAPVPCPEPALRGLRMALEMQEAAQVLIARWRARGHAIGFGVGLAKGPATVGRIGYEGRSDYTAIGNVVNLASRICGAAEDGQILIDATAAAEIGEAVMLAPLGTRPLRGFAEAVPVFSVAPHDRDLATLPAAG